MTYCNKCGRLLESRDRFCVHCGAAIKTHQTRKKPSDLQSIVKTLPRYARKKVKSQSANLCPKCRGKLTFFSSNSLSVRYYCRNCKSFVGRPRKAETPGAKVHSSGAGRYRKGRKKIGKTRK